MNLSIKDLCIEYEGKQVLSSIDIEIKNAHSIAIIGPSGGGKSTLLRIIAGLETPSSGNISINGKDIAFRENFLNEYRKSIGVVFQSYNLFPHISAIENITLPLVQIHKLDKKDAVQRAESLLKRFQLMDHSHKRPSQLSGGQQQRVAIARAIAIKSQFLLLDEPTSALDPELTSEVLDMIDELKGEYRDLILVTHEMGFAKKACDYTLFIADGKVIEHGHSKDIFENPKSEQLMGFLDKILEWQ
ncbi:amino acid ABC transporter ATP-binding protein, PAAT family [Peptoclostridium litorale DSM 5388]|uniref:Glutamate transport ATP-binding protein GluA n=1 Tax=Peptoclostridium litorale DSM 5388 TaxID=1121324 RepID=A0A069RG48_PEPLI|nr:amino acid ABC transporter ATP-binding protein [Peptoclostridium litorale]KDR95130.1 glutamate transport ATP-binding protein GluA [Peptoclostridium litorale DSM 5388]SIN74531.1 amino acid ABC transporter ATP-binding protein, PAAT family [Peptoclostridium litorale DSM 5388]